jgi:hypothetical protein
MTSTIPSYSARFSAQPRHPGQVGVVGRERRSADAFAGVEQERAVDRRGGEHSGRRGVREKFSAIGH